MFRVGDVVVQSTTQPHRFRVGDFIIINPELISEFRTGKFSSDSGIILKMVSFTMENLNMAVLYCLSQTMKLISIITQIFIVMTQILLWLFMEK